MGRFKIKKTRTYNRALPLMMPAGIALYHWSRPSDKLKIAKIQSKVMNTANSPEFKNAISEITPFLDMGVQHNLYTIMGIIDILSATKSLSDGSFQKQHIKIPMMGETKPSIHTVVKVIKRIKADVNGQVLDNAILSYEISDKLFDIMRTGNKDDSPVAKITKRFDELLYTLKPLIPQKYSSNIGKLTRLIKIAQALNATDEILTNSDEDFMKNSDTHDTYSEPKKENPHTGSFDMVAKLVSLLS